MFFVKFIFLCTIYFQIPYILTISITKKLFKKESCFINAKHVYNSTHKNKSTHINSTLSGIQPSGQLHIGNYIGCIKPCLSYQKLNNDLNFMIADNHALSSLNSNNDLRESTKSTIALSLACGIDPNRTNIFVQSHYPQITELNWMISSVFRTEKYYKLSQFKNKEVDIHSKNLATFLYPLLMTSDILSLQAEQVIAGSDQKIHINLARYIAKKLNRRLNSDYFTIPSMYKGHYYRVTSLSDGTKKMSKSQGSPMDTINILDSDEDILLKLKSAKTQCTEDELSPEVLNLLKLYSLFGKIPYQDLLTNLDKSNFFKLKQDLAASIIEHFKPIKEKYYEIINDDKLLESVLLKSRERLNDFLNYRLKGAKRLFKYYIV